MKYNYIVVKGDYYGIDGDQAIISFMVSEGWEFIHAMYVPPNEFTRLYFRRKIEQPDLYPKGDKK